MRICGWRVRNCPGDALATGPARQVKPLCRPPTGPALTIRPYLDLCCQRSTTRKSRHHLVRAMSAGGAKYPMQTHISRSCSHSPSPGDQFAPLRARVNRILSSRIAWPSPSRKVHPHRGHHDRATTWLSSCTSPHGLRARLRGLPRRFEPRPLGVGYRPWVPQRGRSQVSQYASTCSRTLAAGPRPTNCNHVGPHIARSPDCGLVPQRRVGLLKWMQFHGHVIEMVMLTLECHPAFGQSGNDYRKRLVEDCARASRIDAVIAQLGTV